MAKPSNKVKELLGVIKKAPETSSATLEAQEQVPVEPQSRSKVKTRRQSGPAVVSKVGKASPIYLYPEDKQLIRELAAWFAGQGLRINDSLVIRAALRTARPGSELATAYQNATQIDQRFKAQRASSQAS